MTERNERISGIVIYEKLTDAIQSFFAGRDVRYLLLHGGCYWYAGILHRYISDSVIVFNRTLQHCACFFHHGVYDIRGRISKQGFAAATGKDLNYMQKHFIPCFDTGAAEEYIEQVVRTWL